MEAISLTRLMLRAGFLLLSCALLSACAPNSGGEQTAADARTPARTYVYVCADGFEFVTRVEGTTAWLFLPERTLGLPGVPAASGAKYSDGAHTYWSKGDEAVLEVGGRSREGCRNQPARAVWEHAKLGGADFRAVGNEPGWNFEIRSGNKLIFVGDYGRSRHEFTISEIRNDRQERRSVYSAADAQHTLTLILYARPCRDTMSGEDFETTVTVVLDGRTYRGCGRPLH